MDRLATSHQNGPQKTSRAYAKEWSFDRVALTFQYSQDSISRSWLCLVVIIYNIIIFWGMIYKPLTITANPNGQIVSAINHDQKQPSVGCAIVTMTNQSPTKIQ